MNYPLDIRSTEEYQNRFGDFYKGDDFRGTSVGAVAAGYNAEEGGIIKGHIKGWGVFKFSFAGNGTGLDFGMSAVDIWGEYVGDKSPSPGNFAGDGASWGGGILIFTAGYWEGYSSDSKKTTLWMGFFTGGTINPIPKIPGGGAGTDTKTKLIFPMKSNVKY